MIAAKTQPTQLVKKIADRLRDPDLVQQLLFDPSNCNDDPLYPGRSNISWNDLQLIEEYPGVLVLFSELDMLFPEENWDAAVHAYVLKLKNLLESQGVTSPSLVGGATGIAFALQKASRGGTRYQRMIAILNEHIRHLANQNYFQILEENFKGQQPSRFLLYDLIKGIVGIGVYCLNNLHDPSLVELANNILSHVIRLAQPLKDEGRLIPGWYFPHRFLIHEKDKEEFPRGNFNLGVAHGIPGVLSFLSLALLSGLEVDGQREAIQSISGWIKGHRQEHEGHLFWGSHVSFEDEIAEPRVKKCLSTKRNGWCYGTPAIARTLFLAGRAIKSEELKSYALETFYSIFLQTRQEWNLPSPTFCHGIAGFLMTTWMMYRDTRDPFLHQKAQMLKEILLEYYVETNSFGFKNLDPRRNGGYFEISQLSLLEGVSGILLTLLSVDGHSSGWSSHFLIGEGQS